MCLKISDDLIGNNNIPLPSMCVKSFHIFHPSIWYAAIDLKLDY